MCISLAIGMVPVKWLRPPQHWGLQSEAQEGQEMELAGVVYSTAR